MTITSEDAPERLEAAGRGETDWQRGDARTQGDANGITPIPQKVKAVREFPLPTMAKKLREILGVINYYHRFITHAASALSPLHDPFKGIMNPMHGKKCLPYSGPEDRKLRLTTPSVTEWLNICTEG
ncbi:hypothetical protein Pmani_018134 [Petrolisthes manimaculis]|uniref:Reverse transcriptase n=1 Tax=Petrolisthes manimaculis TaxID=1843537 RepID=A0AAE1PM22_9EUCA|nr:hypothetical protein Pmani_018134 [Petrolisthes manimaculis]